MSERGAYQTLAIFLLVLLCTSVHRECSFARSTKAAKRDHAKIAETVDMAHTAATGAIVACHEATAAVAEVRIALDAVSSADSAALDRDTALLCGLLYLADVTGKRRGLNSQPGTLGLKGAPVAGDPWAAFGGRTSCDICNSGYACNSPGPRGGKR